MARFVRLRRGAENVALLPRGDVEKFGLRIVGRRHPIGGADRAWTNRHARQSWGSFFALEGHAACVFRIAPADFPVGSGREKFAVTAVNHVEKTVAVGLDDEMAIAVVHQHRNLRGVVIVLVVLGELEIPFQLARIRIERKQRIAVEIVAGTAFAAIRRRRIAGGPERGIRRGIIGAGNPCGRAADFPGVAFPGFVAGFARTGNGVEAPFARAGHGVISIDEPANAVFAAGNPDEHEMVDHQGRECDAVALTVVRRAHVPNDIARFCVERDDVGVKRAEKNFIAQDGHPAIDAATTGTNIGRQ